MKNPSLVLALITIVSLGVGGCLDSPMSGPPLREPDLLAQIPFEHDLSFEATLKANEWFLWLWQNNIPTNIRDADLPYSRSLQFMAVADGRDPFWMGAFWINVAQDPSTGKAVFMSERAPTLVYYVSNEWLDSDEYGGLTESGSLPVDASDVEGVLMFAQAPVRMTYAMSRGSGGFSKEPAVFARGTNTSVTMPSVATEDDFNDSEAAPSVSLEQASGFLAGAVMMDHRAPYLGETEYEYTFSFPDGESRTREMRHREGPAVPRRCYPEPDLLDLRSDCRKGSGGSFDFMDMTNSCQQEGTATAEVRVTSWSPVIRPAPVIFNIPFDYCPFLGADADTPHPCDDMSELEARGCPFDEA